MNGFVFYLTAFALLLGALIVVHELAHLRIRDHDKEFYRLCQYIEPAYHQLEFDARVWLLWRDAEEGSSVE